MAICAPRTWRISSFDILRRSCPEKNAFPDTIFPGGEAIRPRTESIVTLLPQPLSPTTPNVSPSANPNDTIDCVNNSIWCLKCRFEPLYIKNEVGHPYIPLQQWSSRTTRSRVPSKENYT